MPIINFPSNPTEGQKYTFGNFTYVYKSNRWTGTQSGATTGIDLFKASLADEGSTVTIAGVAAKDLVAQKDGVPVASVIWFPSREMAANGYIPADGQLLSRTVYASLWEMIEGGKVPVTEEPAWLSDPRKRGFYTRGDGSTTFRVPDYNGKTADSLGAAFLRGDGFNSNSPGVVQKDAIRNIKGEAGAAVNYGLTAPDVVSGALSAGPVLGGGLSGATAASNKHNIIFDASLVVPTAPENRPVNVAGVWMIKVFSAAVNEGVIDAAQLGTALATAEAEIEELKSWPQSGSNDNGYWVKHRDGTMICTIQKDITGLTSSSFGVVFANTQTRLTYPEPFVDTPTVTVSSVVAPNVISWATPFSPSPTLTGVIIISGSTFNTSTQFRLQLTAVGRWKPLDGVTTLEEPINDAVTLEEPEGGEFITLEL